MLEKEDSKVDRDVVPDLSRIRSIGACGACIAFYQIGVVRDVLDSTAWGIVLTSKDTPTELAGSDYACFLFVVTSLIIWLCAMTSCMYSQILFRAVHLIYNESQLYTFLLIAKVDI